MEGEFIHSSSLLLLLLYWSPNRPPVVVVFDWFVALDFDAADTLIIFCFLIFGEVDDASTLFTRFLRFVILRRGRAESSDKEGGEDFFFTSGIFTSNADFISFASKADL